MDNFMALCDNSNKHASVQSKKWKTGYHSEWLIIIYLQLVVKVMQSFWAAPYAVVNIVGATCLYSILCS